MNALRFAFHADVFGGFWQWQDDAWLYISDDNCAAGAKGQLPISDNNNLIFVTLKEGPD